ncbi:BNR-4 repeat-containing protein [Arthrobacter sp. Leaf137]|uniref:BNR-4 repeat-containing protein n=1 Tax=Arthrobacter sp. Leaf137 TaxID=1736271 RepID=UPI0006FA21CC|nr:BNR-4 repeat-containing protein [Arthrobacter sp. Leaf137]KQQ83331.1 hypothetical protein ASF64_06890 [Arthrobacter sp. Leaf137]
MLQHLLRPVLTVSSALVVLLAGLVPGAAASNGTVDAASRASSETLPFKVDSSNQAAWWNPVAVANGTTYFAFNAPAAASSRHEVHVASRDDGGAWTEGCLRTDTNGPCVTFLDDNGHNQPSIVVDGNGTIHAFVSMHNEKWNYFRSASPGDVRSMTDATSEMPDLDVDITYPVTASGPDGDAWVLVRTGTDADGAREGVLYHYDLGAGRWERETVIAAAKGYAFYPDDLAVGEDGRLHLLWEWGPFPADPARHLGSYAVYDPDSGTFTDVAGQALTGPITPTTAGAVIWRDLGPDETIRSFTPALQSAKLAMRGSRPAGIVYRFVPKDAAAYDFLNVTWDGSNWVTEMLLDTSSLGSGVATAAALDTTSFGSRTRAYTVLTAQVCGELRSQAVMIEKTQGREGLAYFPVGEQRIGQQRMRAETRPDGTDILYLSAPNAAPAVLEYVELPRAGRTSEGSKLEDIVANLRGELGGVNVALGASVQASSALRPDTGGELAVDGICTDASRWISAVGDTAPSITITLRKPQRLDEIRVRSGYSTDPGTDSVLRSFTVEVHTTEGWTQVGQYTGNRDRLVRTAVAVDLEVDSIRLLISDPSASPTDVARVFEIEAIAKS